MSYKREDSDPIERDFNKSPSQDRDLGVLEAETRQAFAEAEKLMPDSSTGDFDKFDWEKDTKLVEWLNQIGPPPVLLEGRAPTVNEWTEKLRRADFADLTENQKAARKEISDFLHCRSKSSDLPTPEDEEKLRQSVQKKAEEDASSSSEDKIWAPIHTHITKGALVPNFKYTANELAHSAGACLSCFARLGILMKIPPSSQEARSEEELRNICGLGIFVKCPNYDECRTIFSNLNFRGSNRHTGPGGNYSVAVLLAGGATGDAQRLMCTGPCRGRRKDHYGREGYHVSINLISAAECGFCKDLGLPTDGRQYQGIPIV